MFEKFVIKFNALRSQKNDLIDPTEKIYTIPPIELPEISPTIQVGDVGRI